jgi:hypothetical protein
MNALTDRERAHILADLQAYRIYMLKAPISSRAIKGYRPIFEIRTGGFRAYCVVKGQRLWVIHVGRKQSQKRDIESAAQRMRTILGG